MGFRWSCLIHSVALLVSLGCHAPQAIHAPAAPDAEIAEARQFAQAVAEKMPLWDADTIACYEGAEIAAVKADVLAIFKDDAHGAVLEDVARLHEDWNALLALDERLKQQSII